MISRSFGNIWFVTPDLQTYGYLHTAKHSYLLASTNLALAAWLSG